jgi:deoxyribonuclease V
VEQLPEFPTPAQARKLQHKLKDKVRVQEFKGPIKVVAGADISLNMYQPDGWATIVLFSYPDLKPLARAGVKGKLLFPYIPGLLSFREIPLLLEAYKLLPHKPDILLLDGHGIAHPRSLGIATHFGIATSQPTVGCAKKHLYGEFAPPAEQAGSYSPVTANGATVGYALRTKNKVNLVYPSPGHLTGLAQSRELVLSCCRGYRLPEPTRIAHNTVNALRKGEWKPGYEEL